MKSSPDRLSLRYACMHSSQKLRVERSPQHEQESVYRGSLRIVTGEDRPSLRSSCIKVPVSSARPLCSLYRHRPKVRWKDRGLRTAESALSNVVSLIDLVRASDRHLQ